MTPILASILSEVSVRITQFLNICDFTEVVPGLDFIGMSHLLRVDSLNKYKLHLFIVISVLNLVKLITRSLNIDVIQTIKHASTFLNKYANWNCKTFYIDNIFSLF